MKKTSIKIFAITMFLNTILFSQVSQQWVARHNGNSNSNDMTNAMICDDVGNSYVTGWSFINGKIDIVTFKYDPNGTILWTNTFNGANDLTDMGNAIAVDIAGNVYVAGSEGTSAGANDFLVIKYNSSGVFQWKIKLNGTASSSDYGKDIAVDGAGNVYAAGFTGTTAQGTNYFTVKINSAGILLWQSQYNGTASGNDECNAIAIDNSGNVFVTGFVVNTGTGTDIATIKYSSSGVQLNAYTQNGPLEDKGNDVIVNAAGEAFVGGYTTDAATGLNVICIKYGSISWNYSANLNSDTDYVSAMQFDNSGNVIMGGVVKNTTQNFNAFIIKISTAGVLAWSKQFDAVSNSIDHFKALACDINNNIYIAVQVFRNGTFDYATVKYNSAGTFQWTEYYNNIAMEIPSAIDVDNNGNVFIAGSSFGSGTQLDYCLVKYSPVTAITQTGFETPDRFSLSHNYPNPFNPMTTIKYTLPVQAFVKLYVYDVKGKMVSMLVNESQSSGNYETSFSGNEIASGLYFYRLETEDFTEVKKMVLVK